MDKSFVSHLKNYAANKKSDELSLVQIEKYFNVSLPEDYRIFQRSIGGGEGFIGDQYIIIFNAGDIIGFNSEYEIQKYAPRLMLLGSNGGGEGIAYDLRQKSLPVVAVPFVGMDLANIKVIANNFTDMIEMLSKGDETII